MVKLYDSDNVYQRVLNEALYDIAIEKTLYYGSGPVAITLNTKVDDLATDITLNSKIKIFFRNKWNRDPFQVYYGYIVSIDPFIQSGEERTAITCLSAVSKLQNDFLAEAGEYLAYQVENQKIDQHMKEILINYRTIIGETYGTPTAPDYNPCMIDNPATYWGYGPYIQDTVAMGTIPYRYFTMKHLDAVKEIGKFLAKNQGGGTYWYYYLDDGDNTTGKSRFVLKKLSTSADHNLQINKDITSLSMRKNIEGVVNTVYFWNIEGTSKNKVLMTAADLTSQTAYDRIADRITDAKVSTYTQADLLAQARLKEAKDVKAEITVTVSDANFDILNEDNIGLKLGQVINIRDTKKAGTLFPDDVLVIQKIILTPREAVLELAKPRPDLSTQVETDREYIDRQLIWFGNIMTRIDASHLEPGGLHWITEDISFSAPSNTQINWTAGTFKLPNDVHRVIASGNTGDMGTDDTYLYVDEKNVWCTRNTVGTGAKIYFGNGSVKVGENILYDAARDPDHPSYVAGTEWEKDELKGYALWINPSGGSEERHIISQNYKSHLYVEGHDPFNTTDAACPYETHKLVLRETTKLSHSGTALTGGLTTLRSTTLNESNDFWKGYEMKITSGKNIGLTRTINSYIVGSFDLVFDALPYAITGGEHYELYLNSETQIMIVTGIPSTDANETAGINAKVTAATPDFQVKGATRAYDALNTSNILITDLMNDRLDTSGKYIKGEFTFTGSGALKIATDANNGLWLSPTGILAKHLGVNTFTIDALGNATFAGDLTAASGTFGGTVLGTATFVGTSASSIEGKANDAFQKSSDDSADINQDANNRFVTGNEKTGAGRAYQGFTSSYYITRGIVNFDLSSRSLPYQGVRIDSNGIFGRKAGSTTFWINSSGDAYFRGTLGASSMEAGNWLRFYDSSGYDCGSIYASGYDLLLSGSQTISDIIIRSGSSATIVFAVGGSLKSFVNSSFALVANANISMLSHRILHLATPSASTDAATKGYVDGVVGGGCANVWRYISTDSGTATAYGCSDTLSIRGTGTVSTSRSGDTIYIYGSTPSFSCGNLSSCHLWDLSHCYAQSYGGYTGSCVTELADIRPAGDGIFECGWSWRRWYKVWSKYYGGCELPTTNSAIDLIKTIKNPKKRKGDSGIREYFDDDDFPDEMKMFATREEEKIGKGKKEIEFTKTLGVAVQAIRELIGKVEKLEAKVLT